MTFRIPIRAIGYALLALIGCAIGVAVVRSAADVEPVRRVVEFR